jgi:DNA-directed RNA polymerase specialized sigma24 family protein
VQNTSLKKDWKLTSKAFEHLLEWLDEGGNSDGQAYLEMRRRLVTYFDRKNCVSPDELADETLNRAARRLEEENAIETEAPAKYCYIIARFVFLEHVRARGKDQALRDELRREPRHEEDDQTSREIKKRMLDCLNLCADKLIAAEKNLIFRYYFGEERTKIQNRRALAEASGITLNALSIRACRIRDKLELCVRECLGTE